MGGPRVHGVRAALAGACALLAMACHTRGEGATAKPDTPSGVAPDGVAPDGVAPDGVAQDGAETTAAPAAPAAPAPNLRLAAEPGPEGYALSIQNRHGGPVSVALVAEVSAGDRGGPPLKADLGGRCVPPAADACRPLAPGAELLVAPLTTFDGEGHCSPLPPGPFTLRVQTCPEGHSLTLTQDR